MFKRLNTGGETLSEQEIRNATIRLLSNEFNEFISDLSKNRDFVFCIGSISDNQFRKKFDQELVLRFFAYKNSFDAYTHDVADFLTDYMEEVSDPLSPATFDYSKERIVFEKTFLTLRLVAEKLGIGSKVFGTINPRTSEPRGQFSVYHYEGLCLGIQSVIDKVNVEDSEHIDRLASIVRDGKADREFLRHGGAGKNYRNPLRARITYFADRFSEVID
jgi:hypothetical protein